MGFFSFIGDAVNAAAKAIEDAAMGIVDGWIEDLKEQLQINKIEAFFVAILCFAEFLQAIFKWTFETIQTITKYALLTLPCFVFWVFNSFVMFIQYIVFDILLELVLLPSRIVGKSLGYPGTYTYDKKTKEMLYANTNVFQWIIGAIDDNLKIKFKIHKTCFNIGTIKPFPVF